MMLIFTSSARNYQEQILYPTEFPPAVSVFDVIKHSREGAVGLLFYTYNR